MAEVGLCLLFAALAAIAMFQNTAACDEIGCHIPSGYLYLHSGRFSGGLGNPPLGQALIALPVKLLGISYPLFSEAHLSLFRLPVVLMALGLGVAVYLFARSLYGKDAALVSLACYVLCPNILAHGTLATVDLPVSLFAFLAVFGLWRWTQKPSLARAIATSLAIAFAVTTKVSALLLFPLTVMLIVLAWVLLGAGASDRPLRSGAKRSSSLLEVAGLLTCIAFISYLVIHAVYLRMPSLSHALPSQFGAMVRMKLQDTKGGHPAYLLGQYSKSGWWYYFPIALLTKTPLPTLALAGIGLWKLDRRTALFVCLPASAFFAAAMAGNVDIGIRHILPVYPFLHLMAGRGALLLWTRSWKGAVLLTGMLVLVAEAVWIAPHHLSYFNVLAGGSSRGYRVLADSNYDWGLDDRLLERRVKSLTGPYAIDPARPTAGRVFVNANALILKPDHYDWLKGLRPIGRVAYSWFEYDVPRESLKEGTLSLEGENALVHSYLESLQQQIMPFAQVEDLRNLAVTFSRVRDYRRSLQLIGEALERSPESEDLLGEGGSLAVNIKLGLVPFEGDEYLHGYHRSDTQDRAPGGISEAAGRLGLLERLVWHERDLGNRLLGSGKKEEAQAAFDRAERLSRR
jgi:hypothetical protein